MKFFTMNIQLLIQGHWNTSGKCSQMEFAFGTRIVDNEKLNHRSQSVLSLKNGMSERKRSSDAVVPTVIIRVDYFLLLSSRVHWLDCRHQR